MSSSRRIERLGLRHLADKPEELERELQQGVDERKAAEEADAAERKRIREEYLRKLDEDCAEKPDKKS
jgi:hypothetical protein